MCFTSITQSQHSVIYPHSISFTFQPVDLGIGLRYDHQFDNQGVYVSGAWGNYRFNNGGKINNHVKTAIGMVFYIPSIDNRKLTNIFSLGFIYNFYGEKNELCILSQNEYLDLYP